MKSRKALSWRRLRVLRWPLSYKMEVQLHPNVSNSVVAGLPSPLFSTSSGAHRE